MGPFSTLISSAEEGRLWFVEVFPLFHYRYQMTYCPLVDQGWSKKTVDATGGRTFDDPLGPVGAAAVAPLKQYIHTH